LLALGAILALFFLAGDENEASKYAPAPADNCMYEVLYTDQEDGKCPIRRKNVFTIQEIDGFFINSDFRHGLLKASPITDRSSLARTREGGKNIIRKAEVRVIGGNVMASLAPKAEDRAASRGVIDRDFYACRRVA
jgi:hypothetical protein